MTRNKNKNNFNYIEDMDNTKKLEYNSSDDLKQCIQNISNLHS